MKNKNTYVSPMVIIMPIIVFATASVTLVAAILKNSELDGTLRWIMLSIQIALGVISIIVGVISLVKRGNGDEKSQMAMLRSGYISFISTLILIVLSLCGLAVGTIYCEKPLNELVSSTIIVAIVGFVVLVTTSLFVVLFYAFDRGGIKHENE